MGRDERETIASPASLPGPHSSQNTWFFAAEQFSFVLPLAA
jgi:hypothetical protein